MDGRVYLLLSRDPSKEPRFQIDEGIDSQQIFGVDVLKLAPGQTAIVDGSTLGYPARSLGEIPAGEYQVQALLNVYETFKRSDGHTLLLPPDRGEGQQWHEKPGNLASRPQKAPAQGGERSFQPHSCPPPSMLGRPRVRVPRVLSLRSRIRPSSAPPCVR